MLKDDIKLAGIFLINFRELDYFIFIQMSL